MVNYERSSIDGHECLKNENGYIEAIYVGKYMLSPKSDLQSVWAHRYNGAGDIVLVRTAWSSTLDEVQNKRVRVMERSQAGLYEFLSPDGCEFYHLSIEQLRAQLAQIFGVPKPAVVF